MEAVSYVMRRIKRTRKKLWPRKEAAPAVGRVRCREIAEADLDRIIDLLMRGFWRSSRAYWLHVMSVLATHDTPEGYPKYGHMLENDDVPVGVLLMIFTTRVENGVTCVRCCESSYYVEPAFRCYASILVKRGHRFKEVTYLDVTATPTRYVTLDAQGYKPIARSVYAAYPALCRPVGGARVQVATKSFFDPRLSPAEISLLRRHATYKKCIAVVCEHEGKVYPFVFAVRHQHGVVLIYSRNQVDFTNFAGTLGRFLVKRFISRILLDVNEPIAVPGKMLANGYPKYWKGGKAPRLGDLAFTEIAMFGT